MNLENKRVERKFSLNRYFSMFLMMVAKTIPMSKFSRASLFRKAGVVMPKNKNIRIGRVSFDTLNPQDISIGSGTAIADGCILVTHFYDVKNLYEHAYHRGKIQIGSNVYIGSNVIITKPINIGDGAIIAAGSILGKDVQPFEIWGGNPAKFLKSRIENGETPDVNKFKGR